MNNPPALPAGNYFALVPQESTSGANVSMVERSIEPTNSYIGGVTQYAVSSDGRYVVQARMILYTDAIGSNGYPNQGPDYRYSVALHEIGHTLGLKHNQDLGSIMFPDSDLNLHGYQNCYTYNGGGGAGKMPSYPYDTAALETKYDPAFKDDSFPNPTCGGKQCLGAARRLFTQRNYDSLINANTPQTSRLLNVSNSASGLSTKERPLAWITENEFPQSVTMGAEDLALSSSLVVEGIVGATVREFPIGDDKYVVQQVKITNIFRHLLGPDESRKVGDVINIVDVTRNDSGVYIDDPLLKQGQASVVFLRHASPLLAKLLKTPNLYSYASKYVSKWSLSNNGFTLQSNGVRQSRVRHELEGQNAQSLYRRLLQSYGRSAINEESMLRASLARRGVGSENDIQSYKSLLNHTPERLQSVLGSKDVGLLKRTLETARR